MFSGEKAQALQAHAHPPRSAPHRGSSLTDFDPNNFIQRRGLRKNEASGQSDNGNSFADMLFSQDL